MDKKYITNDMIKDALNKLSEIWDKPPTIKYEHAKPSKVTKSVKPRVLVMDDVRKLHYISMKHKTAKALSKLFFKNKSK